MPTISNLKVENFLSLRKVEVRLFALNVLVGANGSGKTNILKVFSFLGEVARAELAPAVSSIGGFAHLLFRGTARNGRSIRIELDGVVTQHASQTAKDEYRLTFWQRPILTLRPGTTKPLRANVLQRSEQLKFKRTKGQGRRITLKGSRVTVADTGGVASSPAGPLAIEGGATGLGTLRRLSDAYGSPEWNSFAEVVERLRLFEIDVERAREPSSTIMSSQLDQNADNLSAFLLWMREEAPEAFSRVEQDVAFVLPSFRSFDFQEIGGATSAVRVGIVEEHLEGVTSLARASYGTIRAIALFAMLHDPNPPKLTCLEEVDHGLHPHALDRIVERLREASSRTQIILATHSPALVNRLSDDELIIVEREPDTGGTRAFRPSKALIRDLRRETGYELGELWFSGALGGAL